MSALDILIYSVQAWNNVFFNFFSTTLDTYYTNDAKRKLASSCENRKIIPPYFLIDYEPGKKTKTNVHQFQLISLKSDSIIPDNSTSELTR